MPDSQSSFAALSGARCRVLLVERAEHAQPTPLLSFSDAAERAGPFARRLPRLETVEVTHIVGSVGRASELGADFRPSRSARPRLGLEHRHHSASAAFEDMVHQVVAQNTL